MPLTGPLLAFLLWTAPTASAADCDPAAEPVTVATLNTWGLPYPLSTDRRGRFARIRDYLGSGLDIVGLQEVWTSARGLLDRQLRLPTAPVDSGLAVVTPLPSTRPVLTPFTRARGPDRLKAKGVLHTRVMLPDGTATHVLVTHMQAGHGSAAADIRASQLTELLAYADGLAGPTLLMGDLNLYRDLDDDLASSDRLRAAGFVDTARSSGDLAPTWQGGANRLDRIYLRGSADQVLDARVPERRLLSDHLPVEATLRLCTPPPDPS